MLTVVAVLCHVIVALPDEPICHEVIVAHVEMTQEQCAMGQPAIAEWKASSIYKDDEWHVVAFKCASGDYLLKNDI